MDLVPPVYWATRSGASAGIPTHAGPGLSRLPLAVGLCYRRPFRCCPGGGWLKPIPGAAADERALTR